VRVVVVVVGDNNRGGGGGDRITTAGAHRVVCVVMDVKSGECLFVGAFVCVC
jgi:hypothetical protein